MAKYKHPKRLYVARNVPDEYTVTGETLGDITYELSDGDTVAIYEIVEIKKFVRTETLK